jgi:hypothetical protein
MLHSATAEDNVYHKDRLKVFENRMLKRLFGSKREEVRSRDISVGTATGWTARVRFPAVQDFSLLHSVQTGSGVHPASYPMGTGGYFPGSKAAGVWN